MASAFMTRSRCRRGPHHHRARPRSLQMATTRLANTPIPVVHVTAMEALHSTCNRGLKSFFIGAGYCGREFISFATFCKSVTTWSNSASVLPGQAANNPARLAAMPSTPCAVTSSLALPEKYQLREVVKVLHASMLTLANAAILTGVTTCLGNH